MGSLAIGDAKLCAVLRICKVSKNRSMFVAGVLIRSVYVRQACLPHDRGSSPLVVVIDIKI